jgi:hypothetical protein
MDLQDLSGKGGFDGHRITREQGSDRSRGAEAAAVTGFLPQALANPTANATRD